MSDKHAKNFDRRLEEQRLRGTPLKADEEPLPDVPVEQAKSTKSAGRNDPCPCGSGKKFKKCCGQSA